MLLELAIGDAYGCSFEFAAPEFVTQYNFPKRGYVQNPGRPGYFGKYTDDTQMSLALAEMILLGLPFTPRFVMGKFFEVFKRDPRGGYARRFEKLLTESTSAEQLLATLVPNSDRAGAAMRATPLGLIPDTHLIIDRANKQASVTHDTDAGRAAAVASALMAHYLAYDLGPKKELGDYLADMVDGPWGMPFDGPVGNIGWECVMAAVTAIKSSNSLSGILKKCIEFTGDVDTVAAISMAAASMSNEVRYDLPKQLFWGLENGPYGKDYIVALDEKLMGCFGLFPKHLIGD